MVWGLRGDHPFSERETEIIEYFANNPEANTKSAG